MAFDNLSLDSLDGQKKKVIAVAALITVLAASIFVFAQTDFELMSEEEELPEENGEENETESGPTGFISADEIEGEITEVVLSDQRADPSRPEISPEDGIEFVNQEDFEVQLEFDREEYETVTLSSGESGVMDIERIVYYEITPVDEDVEYRTPGGTGVNVQ